MLRSRFYARCVLNRPSPHSTRLVCTRSYWTSKLQEPVQSYISTSNDPHVNLSIEHHLLQCTHSESTILFFYTNTPSIIIGRNQNPWYETDLARILPRLDDGSLHLVRRRSGGGTVFHDLGNINWTVISPSKSFARDTHGAMVVRALRSSTCGVAMARLNERHDIVLDQGDERAPDTQIEDESETPWTKTEARAPRPLKCSGSAFKITRFRALHHGTCLLNSKNLTQMGRLLHSPGKAFMQVKGVESVSSPVGNTGVSPDAFIAAVREQFERMYNSGRALAHIEVTKDDAMEEEKLRKGYEELRTAEWTFAQTPRFTFTATTRQLPTLRHLSPCTIHIDVQKGRVMKLIMSKTDSEAQEPVMGTQKEAIHDTEGGAPLYDGMWDWTARLAWLDEAYASAGRPQNVSETLGAFLQQVFPSLKVWARM